MTARRTISTARSSDYARFIIRLDPPRDLRRWNNLASDLHIFVLFGGLGSNPMRGNHLRKLERGEAQDDRSLGDALRGEVIEVLICPGTRTNRQSRQDLCLRDQTQDNFLVFW
ncbi:hypothetical protein DICSQDRAFT_141534 [Dichomitus squalens LYAD-421 SS1]|uniref:Uncharacterized protein n=1 Tax=Dichomitus squalens (strain LYAD-421) TaxID=732165 RepID=R7SJZ1_DICSQ|nr:uncharacterized protein DICSQDRAFT_141534 [Dichomitus squalens LYAD-421 SS1]EJF56050.1 hypothetical protein DICSQDRAFT_141534 [Dichomitus squalens LYAD-421 SS1]